jgi:hypothetical protein
MFAALTSVTDKVLVRIQCASHQMSAEGCGGLRCDDGDDSTLPYGDQTQRWSGPYRTVAAAIVEWTKSGTFDGSRFGRYGVDPGGIVRPLPN